MPSQRTSFGRLGPAIRICKEVNGRVRSCESGRLTRVASLTAATCVTIFVVAAFTTLGCLNARFRFIPLSTATFTGIEVLFGITSLLALPVTALFLTYKTGQGVSAFADATSKEVVRPWKRRRRIQRFVHPPKSLPSPPPPADPNSVTFTFNYLGKGREEVAINRERLEKHGISDPEALLTRLEEVSTGSDAPNAFALKRLLDFINTEADSELRLPDNNRALIDHWQAAVYWGFSPLAADLKDEVEARLGDNRADLKDLLQARPTIEQIFIQIQLGREWTSELPNLSLHELFVLYFKVHDYREYIPDQETKLTELRKAVGERIDLFRTYAALCWKQGIRAVSQDNVTRALKNALTHINSDEWENGQEEDVVYSVSQKLAKAWADLYAPLSTQFRIQPADLDSGIGLECGIATLVKGLLFDSVASDQRYAPTSPAAGDKIRKIFEDLVGKIGRVYAEVTETLLTMSENFAEDLEITIEFGRAEAQKRNDTELSAICDLQFPAEGEEGLLSTSALTAPDE